MVESAQDLTDAFNFVPDHVKPTYEVHRFLPSRKNRLINSIDTDKLFKVDAFIQRLIFYSEEEWESWEMKELINFEGYCKLNKISKPE